jgi:hypothetical protein
VKLQRAGAEQQVIAESRKGVAAAAIWACVAVLCMWLLVAIFLTIHLLLPGDGAQIVFDYTRISPEGLMVQPLDLAPAGLRAGDVVLAVDGRSVNDWLRAAFTGQWGQADATQQALNYTVRRNEQVRTVTVQLTRYPLVQLFARDWSVYVFLAYMAFVSLVVFVRRPQLGSARLFFMMSNAFLAASVMAFLTYQLSDLRWGWLVPSVLFVNIVLANFADSSLLHFALIFPRRQPLLARHPSLLVWVYLGWWLIFGGFIVIRRQAAPTLTALLQLSWQAGVFVFTAFLPIVIGLTLATYRNSSPVERRQIRWILWGETVGALPWAVALVAALIFQLPFRPLLWFLGLFLMVLPTAYCIAIVRERLFDIDLIIRRTAVYTLLTATLVITFFGGVALLQQIFRTATGQNSQLAIVASTLMIAVLANPLRRYIQNAIDGRFFRRKYDAANMLAAFGNNLRDEVDLDRLSDDLVAVVQEAMQPAQVSLWLREPARNRPVPH